MRTALGRHGRWCQAGDQESDRYATGSSVSTGARRRATHVRGRTNDGVQAPAVLTARSQSDLVVVLGPLVQGLLDLALQVAAGGLAVEGLRLRLLDQGAMHDALEVLVAGPELQEELAGAAVEGLRDSAEQLQSRQREEPSWESRS